MNLDLWWTDGQLRFWDPAAGHWLMNQKEERASRLAAETLAESERVARLAFEERVNAERAARLAAEARLAEMESELRRLRGKWRKPNLPENTALLS